MQAVYIYDAIRTPRGKARADGGLHELRPHDLLKCLYGALTQRNGLDPVLVGEVVLAASLNTVSRQAISPKPPACTLAGPAALAA